MLTYFLSSVMPAIIFCSCTLITAHSFIFEPLKRAYEVVPASTTFEKKLTTFLVYVSARNDLAPFVLRNFTQMMQVGSNENLTILIHLDSMVKGGKKVTQRFIVYKNKMVQVGEATSMDSGSPDTLIDACAWGFTRFPSHNPMLVLWNHGIGDLEFGQGRALNPSELYNYNPTTKLIELNRSINFIDYVMSLNNTPTIERGICFDDVTGHYLTNRQVGIALEQVCTKYLDGKPLACLLCDACLMNGIGFSFSLKPHGKKPVARVLIGSQEVVLATGYPYHLILAPLSRGLTNLNDFAQHVIKAFTDTYNPMTHDYTQSAIALEIIDPLYENINTLAHLLIEGLKYQKNASVKNFIKRSSEREVCTCFEEKSYKDMYHLFSNMLTNTQTIILQDSGHTNRFKNNLNAALTQTCQLIKQIVIANSAGANLKNASGISIYLPEGSLHQSFQNTDFGQYSAWCSFVKLYAAK